MEEISVETQVLEVVQHLRNHVNRIDELVANDDLEDLHYWIDHLEQLFIPS